MHSLCKLAYVFFLRIRHPPGPPPFPYTTLSRSGAVGGARHQPDDRRRVHAAREEGAERHVRHQPHAHRLVQEDRKSTRLNSSHANISYAVFCLKKKKNLHNNTKRENYITTHTYD